MNDRLALVVLCALGWLLPVPQGQEPKPAPPAEKPTETPAETPAPAEQNGAAEPARHPFEGVYELRRRVIAGMVEPRASRGYVAITNRHMILCLAGPGTDPDLPLVRAGVRTWKQTEHAVQTEVKLGFHTDENGGIHIEPRGERASRRVEIARGLLRIFQDDRSYLEFERIE